MSYISEQLMYTLGDFKSNQIPGDYYRGKVRDNYYIDDKMLMITSDRVSASWIAVLNQQ